MRPPFRTASIITVVSLLLQASCQLQTAERQHNHTLVVVLADAANSQKQKVLVYCMSGITR